MAKIQTVTVISDAYLETSFIQTVLKLPTGYDMPPKGTCRYFFEVVRSGRKHRCAQESELIAAVGKLGVDPKEYAASEPETLARALAWLRRKGNRDEVEAKEGACYTRRD
jgi:hypothetical protein